MRSRIMGVWWLFCAAMLGAAALSQAPTAAEPAARTTESQRAPVAQAASAKPAAAKQPIDFGTRRPDHIQPGEGEIQPEDVVLVTCPPGSVPENEANCGLPIDTKNGGCTTSPPRFSPTFCDLTYCSTAAYDGVDRDTDWYEVTLTSQTYVTWTVSTEFRAVAGLIAGTNGVPNCQNATGVFPFVIIPANQTGSVTICLGPGTWWWFVAPDFAGPPFPCGLKYTATLTCEEPCPGGACCINGNCQHTDSQQECIALEGVYQGENTICTASTCNLPANDQCANATQISCGMSVIADLRNATLDMGEPIPSCQVAGAVASVWYRFIGTGQNVHLSTCFSEATDPLATDSLIGVYAGNCGQLNQVTCADDSGCGSTEFLSELCFFAVNNAVYHIQVLCFDDLTRARYKLDISCAPCPIVQTGACCLPGGDCIQTSESGCIGSFGIFRGVGVACDDPLADCPQVGSPTNDDCFSAIPLSIPSSTPGYTYFATPDFGTSSCGLPLTSPGVWYTVQGNGNRITATLCGFQTDFDAQMRIYCGDCLQGTLVCAAAIDDGDPPCGLRPEITWCSEAGRTYYILISGFQQAVGEFVLTVIDDGVPCPFPPVCAQSCTVSCPQGSTPEGEPPCGGAYVDQTNGGCGSSPPVYGQIACGETVCGTSGTFMNVGGGQSRDTDWFRFTLVGEAVVTWRVQASFLAQMVLVNTDCEQIFVFASETGNACQIVEVSALLQPGEYNAFISPQFFEGVNCGEDRIWHGTLECAPTPNNGACCLVGGDCIETTLASCNFQNGAFAGVGVPCTPNLCGGGDCPADFDGDGDIDTTDLNILLSGFGCTGGGCAGDADHDGDTDSTDLNFVLSTFGTMCP